MRRKQLLNRWILAKLASKLQPMDCAVCPEQFSIVFPDEICRYIYIPVGGSKNTVLATLLVFTFVALWHDLSFKLLAWGWLVSLFILPELVARRLASSEMVGSLLYLWKDTEDHMKYGHRPWYRHLAATGGVINILMMMSANLVGFVLGLDGMKHLLRELTSTASGE